MTVGWGSFFFCLASGAALGCLFLLFDVLRILLGAGKLLTAVLDLLCCCFCGAGVFLCALAVDYGRLRLFQALFQLLGGWAAAAALGPFTAGLARMIRGSFCKVSSFFQRSARAAASFFRPGRRENRKNREKTGKKPKKTKKRT